MLKRLTIKNVALIKELDLEFFSGLNILSGETGAGKSIIVDSLMLLLGSRYDPSLLKHGESEGLVEGFFEIGETSQKSLNEFGFEGDSELLITRKFNSQNKHEIRINGKIATLSMLKALMQNIVDIYGQGEHQNYILPIHHIKLLDSFAKSDFLDLPQKVKTNYLEHLRLVKEIKNLGDADERERNRDFLSYQIEEIKKAKTYEGEEEELIERRRFILGAERINEALGEAYGTLNGDESSNAVDNVRTAYRAIDSISSFSTTLAELSERLNSLFIELKDISASVGDEVDAFEFDEKDLDKIEARLDAIRTLKRKYGDYQKMQKFLIDAEATHAKLENGAELFDKLTKEKETNLKTLYNDCKELSDIRRKKAEKFEKLISQTVKDLGMPQAVFKIVFNDFPTISECEKDLSQTGLDNAEFYFSANPGQPIKPLTKIISGGEMSRFILALKVILSSADDIEVMVFDEIDVGISGIVGQEIAKKLASIAFDRQVLCVTHLSSIAAMADSHYFIKKTQSQTDTSVTVSLLDNDSSIGEVARLSGSLGISESSNENAKEMKNWSNNYKLQITDCKLQIKDN
ncbi:MAG: DNA repair protein RecN [Firmicutes bacterium]|nr:DNA repair protein RecN [Bacillota bacterium]